ncbi:MAG: hypothetical protein Q7K35_05315 [bacterium]|nr:hypothetical protein [bacterium]
MIIITKSFGKQLKNIKISLDEIKRDLKRTFNKNIFRRGDALISNSFIPLKNCLVAKIRVGYKNQARMLALFLIVNNIKIPFFIARKNDKKSGANVSLKNEMKKTIKNQIEISLKDFNNGDYEEIKK